MLPCNSMQKGIICVRNWANIWWWMNGVWCFGTLLRGWGPNQLPCHGIMFGPPLHHVPVWLHICDRSMKYGAFVRNPRPMTWQDRGDFIWYVQPVCQWWVQLVPILARTGMWVACVDWCTSGGWIHQALPSAPMKKPSITIYILTYTKYWCKKKSHYHLPQKQTIWRD